MLLRLRPALLLLCCAVTAGCVSVPTSPAPAGPPAPARQPQQVRVLPAWPTPAEPRTYATLETAGPHTAQPSTPLPGKGVGHAAASSGRGVDHPRAAHRRTVPPRVGHGPAPRRAGTTVPRRPAPRARPRPAAPRAPLRRPRAPYDPGMVCAWARGVTDPATVAACRKQYGR